LRRARDAPFGAQGLGESQPTRDNKNGENRSYNAGWNSGASIIPEESKNNEADDDSRGAGSAGLGHGRRPFHATPSWSAALCESGPTAAHGAGTDTDGDGVPDSEDWCAGTAAGAHVGSNGCATG